MSDTASVDEQRQDAWALDRRPRTLAGRIGNVLYGAFIVAVTSFSLWLASNLSGANTFSEVRPALQTALAPFAALVGKNQPIVPHAVATASGQVVAMETIEVKSPVSANVISLNVKEGDTVPEGALIARLDETAAVRAVRDAEVELANAKLEFERARLLATNDNTDSSESRERAASTALADTFTNMPWVVNESDEILFGRTLDSERANINFLADKASAFPETAAYRDAAASSFTSAAEAYRRTRISYQAWKPGTGTEALLRDTEAMLRTVVQSLVASQTFISFVKENYASPPVPPMVGELEDGLIERSQTASDNLTAVSNALAAYSSVVTTPVSQSVDVEDARLRVVAAENALADARRALDTYRIIAPVGGVVAELIGRTTSVVEGQVLAHITSPQNVARIALGEGDVGKVRAGEEITVMFPGVSGLEIRGKILSVDDVGTVANNTVTFYAYIAFPEGESRPRPGMSVSVNLPN